MDRDEIRRMYRGGTAAAKNGGNLPLFIKQFFVCFLLICAAFAIKDLKSGDLAVFKANVKDEITAESDFSQLSLKLDNFIKDLPVFNNNVPETQEQGADDTSLTLPASDEILPADEFMTQESFIVETGIANEKDGEIPEAASGVFSDLLLPVTEGSYLEKNFYIEYSDYFLADEPLENKFYEDKAREEEELQALAEIKRQEEEEAARKEQEKEAQSAQNSDIPFPEDATKEKIELGIKISTPLKGTVTSGFGYRLHPVNGQNSFHYGLDIAANTGTEIVSAFKGTVDEVGYSTYYGNFVRIRYNGNLTAFYGHCSKIKVKEGASVNRGQVIATVGNTGISTGSHLHFEFKYKGVRLNPAHYINP